MFAKARYSISSGVNEIINQFDKVDIIGAKKFVYIIRNDYCATDNNYLNALRCYLKMQPSEAIHLINTVSLFWDVFNCSCFIAKNLKEVSIEKITNKYVLIGAALLVFYNPTINDNDKENFSQILARLCDIDPQSVDAVITECEINGKYSDYLVYLLNSVSPEHRIVISLCLTFDYSIINNDLERTRFNELNAVLESINDDVWDDISITVKDRWDDCINGIIDARKNYGVPLYNRYSNFILKCLSRYYSNNRNLFVNDIKNLLNRFTSCENEWYWPNQDFCGPYFALITKFYFLRLINDESKIINKITDDEEYVEIEMFKNKQFRYIHFWKFTALDYTEYLSFD